MGNPLYMAIMQRRTRFYGNTGGNQIGFTQNGDGDYGRFTGYDRRAIGEHDRNRYPYYDDDRTRMGDQRRAREYPEQNNGYPRTNDRDFELRKGGI